jgi:hypothetical protein
MEHLNQMVKAQTPHQQITRFECVRGERERSDMTKPS